MREEVVTGERSGANRQVYGLVDCRKNDASAVRKYKGFIGSGEAREMREVLGAKVKPRRKNRVFSKLNAGRPRKEGVTVMKSRRRRARPARGRYTQPPGQTAGAPSAPPKLIPSCHLSLPCKRSAGSYLDHLSFCQPPDARTLLRFYQEREGGERCRFSSQGSNIDCWRDGEQNGLMLHHYSTLGPRTNHEDDVRICIH